MKTIRKTLTVAGIMAIAVFLFIPGTMAQSVQDIDGNTYKTVRIGAKAWTTSNLNVTRFRNGDSIPCARTAEEWIAAGKAGQPAWCYYDNSDSIGAIHGKLYNWFAITDPRGLAPQGTHIPQNADWTETTKSLGGVDYAGIKMKSPQGWKSNIQGTNRTGFTALPGGIRNPDGTFAEVNQSGQWWSASLTIRPPIQAYSLKMKDTSVEVFYLSMDKSAGLSVRVVQD